MIKEAANEISQKYKQKLWLVKSSEYIIGL